MASGKRMPLRTTRKREIPSTPSFQEIPNDSIHGWAETNWKPAVAGVEVEEQDQAEQADQQGDAEADPGHHVVAVLGQEGHQPRAEGRDQDQQGEDGDVGHTATQSDRTRAKARMADRAQGDGQGVAADEAGLDHPQAAAAGPDQGGHPVDGPVDDLGVEHRGQPLGQGPARVGDRLLVELVDQPRPLEDAGLDLLLGDAVLAVDGGRDQDPDGGGGHRGEGQADLGAAARR